MVVRTKQQTQMQPARKTVIPARSLMGWLFAVVVIALLSHTALADEPFFTGLGMLPDQLTSAAFAISGDGQVVVGQSGNEAIRWTYASEIEGLGLLSAGDKSSKARGASADGSVIVGNSAGETNQAFRWTNGTMTGLGYCEVGGDSLATATTGNGQTVAGFCSRPSLGSPTEAFLWNEKTGIQPLGFLPGDSQSSAIGISRDGAVIAGSSGSPGSIQAFISTPSGGMHGLGYLPGDSSSAAEGISADGSVLIGASVGNSHEQAFRWSEATGMVGLGYLPGGLSRSEPLGVSADGSTIVGWARSATFAQEAFIWDAGHGMQRLKDVLESSHELDLSGWRLLQAYGVSDDGQTIVGTSLDPQGYYQGFVAHIPEPATLGLIALAAMLLKRQRPWN